MEEEGDGEECLEAAAVVELHQASTMAPVRGAMEWEDLEGASMAECSGGRVGVVVDDGEKRAMAGECCGGARRRWGREGKERGRKAVTLGFRGEGV